MYRVVWANTEIEETFNTLEAAQKDIARLYPNVDYQETYFYGFSILAVLNMEVESNNAVALIIGR